MVYENEARLQKRFRLAEHFVGAAEGGVKEVGTHQGLFPSPIYTSFFTKFLKKQNLWILCK